MVIMDIKKYTVLKQDEALGIDKGDVFEFSEDSNGYVCHSTDEEIITQADGSQAIYSTTSLTILPVSLVENDSDTFELIKEPVNKSEVEEKTPEEIKKEFSEEGNTLPGTSDTFKVILAFPGAKEGDIYKYNDKRNTFVKQSVIEEDEYLLGILTDKIDELSVETVFENIDYFEDITVKPMKDKETIMMKIADLAEQREGLDKLLDSASNKLVANKCKKQIQIIDRTIEALEWTIGEGKDFLVETVFDELVKK